LTRLLVSGLGKQRIILGFPWLSKHNPDIDWKTGKFAWRIPSPGKLRPLKIKRICGKPEPLVRAKILARQACRPTIVEEPDPEEGLNRTQNPTPNDEILIGYLEEVQKPNEIWVNAKTSNAIEFHLKYDEKKENLPLEQQIPEAYHDYLDVFNEEKADRFPEPRTWDHKIELKEGFEPKSQLPRILQPHLRSAAL